jgi:hypothetical protein
MEPTAPTDLRGAILGLSHLGGMKTTQLEVAEGVPRADKEL